MKHKSSITEGAHVQLAAFLTEAEISVLPWKGWRQSQVVQSWGRRRREPGPGMLIIQLTQIQLTQVLQHRCGFSQTSQNCPAGHVWLCVKFQFPQPASPIACQSLSSHGLSAHRHRAGTAAATADGSLGPQPVQRFGLTKHPIREHGSQV